MLNEPTEGDPQQAGAQTEPTTTEGSEGATATPATEEPQSDATPTAPAQVSDDSGEVDRLRKDLQAKEQALAALGIDANSSTVDQLAMGLLKPEDLLRPQQPESPPATLSDKIRQIKEGIGSSEPVTEDKYRKDMSAALDLVGELVESQDRQQREQEIQSMVERNKSASKSVFAESEVLGQLPQDLHDAAENLMLGMTDLDVGQFSLELPPDRRYQAMTPQVYSKFAGNAKQRFEAIYKHAFEAGKLAAQGNPAPTVNPIAPGGGPTPPPAPETSKTHTLDQLEQNVNAYLAGTQLRV
ncbi:MAG: hypothetical protein ACYTEQ_21815 [Planctomycetota bacterium]|jgi:hypothetical protein